MLRVSRARAGRPSGRRVLTCALVAAVAVSGLTGLEAWPLTGWRLFSERRLRVTTRYEARAVAADGTEVALPFGSLPHAYSGSEPLLEHMAGQQPADREPVCRAWADATTRLRGTPVAEVRVYEVTNDLGGGGTRAAVAWACGRNGR